MRPLGHRAAWAHASRDSAAARFLGKREEWRLGYEPPSSQNGRPGLAASMGRSRSFSLACKSRFLLVPCNANWKHRVVSRMAKNGADLSGEAGVFEF